MQQIRIKNNQDCAVIDIEGTIGVPEQWQFEDPQQRVATYERFRTNLAAIEEIGAPQVVVNIRSTGGDVGDALLIYDALSSLEAEITTRCWGYVASAATVIAQAASEGLREISPNALYLIHNSTCSAEGNARELEQRVELLRKSDERLAEIYATRSGRDVESFVELMSEEAGEGRWLSAEEAIEAALADKLIESVPVATKVAQTLESALSSVKGMIHKIGEQLMGEESPEAKVEPATIARIAHDECDETPQNLAQTVAREAVATASKIAFEQEQEALTPTALHPIEDPSLSEAAMSANETAYLRDARRMSRGF